LRISKIIRIVNTLKDGLNGFLKSTDFEKTLEHILKMILPTPDPHPFGVLKGGENEKNWSFWSTLCSKNSKLLGFLPLPLREGGRGVRF
jgi:hypothetical protein